MEDDAWIDAGSWSGSISAFAGGKRPWITLWKPQSEQIQCRRGQKVGAKARLELHDWMVLISNTNSVLGGGLTGGLGPEFFAVERTGHEAGLGSWLGLVAHGGERA
jgi:hypothetical protein